MKIFNFGTRKSFGTEYKPFDVEGLALEFAKFEQLYDTNRQAYDWLYDTGYGEKIWTELVALSGGRDPALTAVIEARAKVHK